MDFGSLVISFPPFGPDVVVATLLEPCLGHGVGGLVEGLDNAVDLEVADSELLDEGNVGPLFLAFLFYTSGDLFGLGAVAAIRADLFAVDVGDFVVVAIPVDCFPAHFAL